MQIKKGKFIKKSTLPYTSNGIQMALNRSDRFPSLGTH